MFLMIFWSVVRVHPGPSILACSRRGGGKPRIGTYCFSRKQKRDLARGNTAAITVNGEDLLA